MRPDRRVISAARQRFGRRVVNWTPEFMGFGNQLYLWVWAHAHHDDRLAPKVLLTDKMRYWAALAPDFADRFIVARHDVRFLDQRAHFWAEPEKHSGDPRGFTDEVRSDFIRTWLMPSPMLRGLGSGPLASPDALVLNVRRGDYYSDPGFRDEFGLDVEGYVHAAMEGSLATDGPVRRVHVVSDDLDWCRERLRFLSSMASQVTYADPTDSPRRNLVEVASARRLIITNSTFSMWAAAISNTLHGDNVAQVWIPAFFQKRYGPGRCYEYDAGWSAVDELPGGWQPQWMLEGSAGP